MALHAPPLPWLEPGEKFPATALAWDGSTPAPGLLAAGGALDAATLCEAYRHGIFPWFSQGQPVLWWSPDPRMVLDVARFRLHRSLRQTITRFTRDRACEIRFDNDFGQVINACAASERFGQDGTWIVPQMIGAYSALHKLGKAHSVETWIDGELMGGLYCVALGKAVFGESMFSRQSDASKIALAALVAFCRAHAIPQIDCQQNTDHLASLGAQEVSRADFLSRADAALQEPAPIWRFEPLYWQHLLDPRPAPP